MKKWMVRTLILLLVIAVITGISYWIVQSDPDASQPGEERSLERQNLQQPEGQGTGQVTGRGFGKRDGLGPHGSGGGMGERHAESGEAFSGFARSLFIIGMITTVVVLGQKAIAWIQSKFQARLRKAEV